MNSIKTNTSKTERWILSFFILLTILAIVFLYLSGGNAYQSKLENQVEITKNVQMLKEMEAKTPTVIRQNGPVEIPDMLAEQNKVLAISSDNYNADQLKSWYQNTVILGDSITAAARDYGFLGGDVVLAQIGGSLDNSAAQFENAKAIFPSIIFLCFGSNDVSNFMSNYTAFIGKYADYINQLKAVNPNVTCYVSAVFPMQPMAFKNEPGGVYQPQYNAALQQFCNENDNVYYIDSSFILERMPELYDGDGIHPTSSFYPKWLTYMADLTGLSSTGS